MSTRFRIPILLLLVLSLINTANAGSFSDGMSPSEFMTNAALESTGVNLFDLVLLSNAQLQLPQPQLLGAWTGTINDNGWVLNFSGNLAGQPITLVDSGAAGLNQVQWTVAGNVGVIPITANGSLTYDPTFGNTGKYYGSVAVTGGIEAGIAFGAGICTLGVGLLFGAGTALISDLASNVLAKSISSNTSLIVPAGASTACLNSGVSSDGTPFGISQFGERDLTTGASWISTYIVPEPNSFLLVTSLLGVTGLRWRRLIRKGRVARRSRF